MENLRGDEVRSVAADISLGRGAGGYPPRLTPPLARSALTARPAAWLARLRPGALLVGLTPAIATLLYIWGQTGRLDPLIALCTLVGIVFAISGASLLDVYLDARRAAWALQEPWASRRTLLA